MLCYQRILQEGARSLQESISLSHLFIKSITLMGQHKEKKQLHNKRTILYIHSLSTNCASKPSSEVAQILCIIYYVACI